MTDKEKTDYTRLALSLCSVAIVTNRVAELIWRTVEGIQEKKGGFSIMDSCKIEEIVRKKYEEKTVKAVKTTSKAIKLPILSVGGRKVTLSPEQKNKLRREIKQYGIDSTEVKLLILDITAKTRTEKRGDKIIQRNITIKHPK